MRLERVHCRGEDRKHHTRCEEKGSARELLADEWIQPWPVTAVGLDLSARRVGDDGVAALFNEGNICGCERKILE